MPENRDTASPLDAFPWPEQFSAHVVDSQPTPAIHGYDVDSDLAQYYGVADVLLLTLTTELPDESARSTLQVALVMDAPTGVSAAPTHAGVLGEVTGASSSALLGIVAVSLAEQARDRCCKLRPFLVWLPGTSGELPACARASDDVDRAAIVHLREALARRGVRLPVLAHDLGRDAAIVAAYWLAGLRAEGLLECAAVLAKLPAAIAKALRTKPLSLRRYPMNLPPFDYRGSR